MLRRLKSTGFALAVLLLIGVILLGLRYREPRHRGRTLTSWLKQYYDTPLDKVHRRSEAEKAIQAIGADKAQRHLLDMAEAQDGPCRTWLIRKNETWHFRFLGLKEAVLTQQLGIDGFEILGTNCASAVPELTRLLQDTNHAFTALRCLVGIEKPAEIPVCQALTNQNPEIRSFAASQLAWVTDDIDVYLERLKVPLNDADASVRFAAVQALGLQKEYPKEVIPLLVQAMGDSAQSVSGYAAKFLGELGTNGVGAFGALSNVVENGNRYMANHALRSLVSIAPDRALPMTLAWLRSSDPDLRARGAWVFGEFETVTPEILDLLKHAKVDSDIKVAKNAVEALRKYRDRERPRGRGEIIFDGEPNYKGRPLGGFLKQRPDSDELPQESQNAIREMGTNIIPALFARLVYQDEKYDLPDDEVSVGAVRGFLVLGDGAVSALPKLERLVNGQDRRLALYALMASCTMGTSSVPLITGALTNRHADVRSQAVGLFSEGPLKSLPEARKNAALQISALLTDPDEFVRRSATNALKELDLGAATRGDTK